MKHKLKQGPRNRRNKEHVRKWAIKEGRKVLWKCDKGEWHAATDRQNTPHYAIETEDLP